jgi:glutamate--cysteine ligase
MSNPGEEDATPIASGQKAAVRQLAEYLAVGGKPRAAWRIGTEHEKFGFHRPGTDAPFSAPPYEPGGIRAMLEGIAGRGWEPILDQGNLIGLKKDGESVSLEPGGQFELSGAPVASLHETVAELDRHFADVHAVAGPLGLGFAPLGFHPTARRADMPFMPKSRYVIMRRYMPLVGSLGLDMMLRTCTVQVNLDFADETDMVRKLRAGLLLQPVATALFANSPFTEGKPNGFLSARANVWTDTDAARTGVPGVFLEDGFGFEAYVEWLLDVPMYFAARHGTLRDVAGASFRDYVAGRVEALADLTPTLGDFADHITTTFPEVRLKRFLEMRGADAGSPAMMVAQSAFWVGLLYDEAALEAALAVCRRYTVADLVGLRAAVPRMGLGAPLGDGTLARLAGEAVEIAAGGLRARGLGEEALLAPLQEITAGGPTQAEAWLALYHGEWRGDVTRIFEAAAI